MGIRTFGDYLAQRVVLQSHRRENVHGEWKSVNLYDFFALTCANVRPQPGSVPGINTKKLTAPFLVFLPCCFCCAGYVMVCLTRLIFLFRLNSRDEEDYFQLF